MGSYKLASEAFCVLVTCILCGCRANEADYAGYVNAIGTTASGHCFCQIPATDSGNTCLCNVNGIRSQTEDHEAALVMEELHSKERAIKHIDQWPTKIYDARRWHPLLGILTGKEEPLFHLQMFPLEVPKIGTKFYLFDRFENRKRPKQLTYNEVDLGKTPTYDGLFIVVHGWRETADNLQLIQLKAKLIDYSSLTDPGVILVDWREGASKGFDLQKCLLEKQYNCVYKQSAANAVIVGRELALIMYLLVKLGRISEGRLHLIGCGLGGHVSHFASQWFRKLFADNGFVRSIGRLTALDPDARDFEGYTGSHVVREDAHFVDVIHTSAVYEGGSSSDVLNSRFGMSLSVGAIDFYPNGGHRQPGCFPLKSTSCNQRKAIEIFTYSLDVSLRHHDLISVPCYDWEDYSECRALRTSREVGILSKMGIDSVHYCGSNSHYLSYPIDETIKANDLMTKTMNMFNVQKLVSSLNTSARELVSPSIFKRNLRSIKNTAHFAADEDAPDERDHPLCGLFGRNLKRRRRDASGRILHGVKAYLGQFPWMVTFSYFSNSKKKSYHFCGGTIISEHWLLTAAHCFNTFPDGTEILVTYGSASYYPSINRRQTTIVIKKKRVFGPHGGENVFIHDANDECTGHNDVALVRLSADGGIEELPHDTYEGGSINRVCLYPKEPFVYDDRRPKTVNVAGFGVTDNKNVTSKYLMMYRALLAPASVGVYPHWKFRYVTDRYQLVFITDHPAQSQTCKGDSGGAAIYYSDLKKSWGEFVAPQRAFQVGVVNFGSPALCEHIEPVVKIHARLAVYTDWIQRVITSNS